MSAPQFSRRLPSRVVPFRRRPWMTFLAALAVLGGALVLAACGSASTANNGPFPTRTVGNSTPGVTQTPGVSVYAYLYSRVDYPLQIPVNSGDSVTLALSPNSNILTVTPTAGSGTTTVGGPIPLPTDVQDYQDIGAAVDTQSASTATSPIVWQLTSAPRQSLLTPASSSGARSYLDSVKFVWHVQAVAAGQNLIEITLHLYYVYLDGSEHDGSLSVTQTPIPMVAVVPTPLNTTLPPLRLPIAGLSWLAGIIAAIRFIWGAIHTFHDVTDPIKDVATAAQTVRTHLGSVGQNAQQAQQPQHTQAATMYPNPWSQRAQTSAGLYPPPPAQNAPASNQPAPPRSSSPQGQPPAGSQRPWPPTP